MSRQDLIALHRFGLGGTPDARKALASDPRAACLAELKSKDAALLSAEDLPDTARALQLVATVQETRRQKRAQKKDEAQNAAMNAPAPSAPMPSGVTPPASPVMAEQDEMRLGEIFQKEAAHRINHAVSRPVGFAERWALFWANHFCVSVQRGPIIRAGAGVYEREAIRPHVFGPFRDLLSAVEQHPVMLHYLDQRQSIGPNSPAGQRQKKGLNENLAREILELHTLGVKGGYSQADVTSFARVLTGWTLSNNEEMLDGYGGFFFAPNRHEPGSQTVMGKVYAQPGKEQGLAVLRDLAAHPATARFLATKIARHFVADTPPPALVARLERAWRDSNGQLGVVAETLLKAEESWALPLTKLRTPYQFLLAALRASGEKLPRIQFAIQRLNVMGQPLWQPPGPNGHGDDEATLAAPKAIKSRLDVAQEFGRMAANRIDARELAEQLFGDALSSETRQAIARAETKPQGLAILLMSPEFQRS